MPITPACSGFLISDLHTSSQMIGEKNEVKAKWIKEGCKTSPIGPKRMIQGKNLRTKAKHQKAAFKKRQNWWARDHHGLPVVFTTAHGGGRTVMLPRTHGRVSLLLPVFRFSSRLFDFLAVLCDKSLSFSAIEESIVFYNHSYSHRIAGSRLERVWGRRRRLAKWLADRVRIKRSSAAT